MIAHAIGHHGFGFACCGHHYTARAHAKRVHAPPAGQVQRQLVVCRAQCGMPGRRPVLGAVNERLRMLDARADGKRLLQQGEAVLMQRGQRIARTVADGNTTA